MRHLTAAVVLLLLTPVSSTSGQTGAARLTGVVTDPQHAVLPGPTVVATSNGTQHRRQQKACQYALTSEHSRERRRPAVR